MRYLQVVLLVSLFSIASPPTALGQPATHQELIDFFFEWRAFQSPEMIDGVPDYSAAAMADQHRELREWQGRLARFDTTGWSVSNQVDWYLVWAEMNGLEFAHSIKKPWSRDPAFYVWFYNYPTDVPEREAPNIHGAIELPYYPHPLSQADAAEVTERLQKAPAVFAQAKQNLTGNARDLWVTSIRTIRNQSASLGAFAEEMASVYPDMAQAAREAQSASDDLAAWLEAEAPNKTGPSGVGKAHYTWNLRNVHLLPYTWEEEVLLMKRELARSHSSLRLEEHNNRHLPGHSYIQNAEEYDQKLNAAVDEYMEFLESEEIVSIKPYMDQALRERIGRHTPSEGIRGFFSEITYRDAMVMRTHHYHWIELAQLREEPHENPIRQTALLYNIFDGRAEGLATGMEEMMMHAGLLDEKPRARELIWVLLAQRAARGLGGLYQHGLEMTLDEATKYASKWTPWNILPADGATIQGEEQFYLRQPGYGTSYVIGKIEIEMLMAEYARQREGNFVLKAFMDELNNIGIIPVSLIYWEMTGDRSMLDGAIGIR